MEVDGEICDRRLWTSRNWGQISLYLMHQKCSVVVFGCPSGSFRSVYCKADKTQSKCELRGQDNGVADHF